MSKHPRARVRPWQATLILTLFFVAVAGAAAIGWWYARESPPHQGPIVLISVDGLAASRIAPTEPSDPPPAGETLAPEGSATPAIDALAADAVIFERAYTQSTELLPALASALSGQLPFEHRVRDDAGFTLLAETRTLAELLRNRGFSTGAVVSSALVRQDTGLAQGFSFFMEPLPMSVPASLYGEPGPRRGDVSSPEKDDALTIAIDAGATEAATQALDAAESWARSQRGQRYFLFVQVDAEHADDAVSRISRLLQERRLYDDATIVFAGDRGRAGANTALDEETLRVPLLIKQPAHEGARRHVAVPVQQIDLLPTILDLVRAPVPGNLRGRSLRSILSDEDGRIASQPIYSESLAAHFRFGGDPVYALTVNDSRYIRAGTEELVRLGALPIPDALVAVPAGTAANETQEEGQADDIAPLRATLDRFLSTRPIEPPARATEADEDRLALAGYLPGMPSVAAATDAALDDRLEQQAVASAHYAAARLVGRQRLPSAIRTLQGIVREHPGLAVVHYQIGVLSAKIGRMQDAVAAFRTAATLRPDAPELPRALATALVRAGHPDEAQIQADLAVTLAQPHGPQAAAAAHQVAARVALARKDADAALEHADAVQAADPTIPMRPFVQGTLLVDAGQFEEAVPVLEEAAATLHQHESSLEGLQASLATALSHMDRSMEAETAYREELRAFPHSVAAYAGLGMLFTATRREAEVEGVVDDLLAAAPTPEGFAAAARLWTAAGQRSRADALTADARARFRGDSPAALPGRDGRR